MIVMGVDENGLGPRLGPLVVTAVTAEADDAGFRIATRPARGNVAARLGDSKKLVSYNDSSLGEAWARALVPTAETPDSLINALCLDSREVLTRACPSDHIEQCWHDEKVFLADPELSSLVAKDAAKLAKKGLRVVRAEIAIVCTRVLNEAADRGVSRFTVDLHTMERLVLSARSRVSEDVHAVCGKVGGFDRYGTQFGPLGGRMHTALIEGRAKSEYQFPGVGTLSFLRDADASSSLVGLASLIGKWARDLLMARVVRYHQRHDAELPNVSGYHDPVTSRFIRASALMRKKRELPDDCFERTKARVLSRDDASGLLFET